MAQIFHQFGFLIDFWKLNKGDWHRLAFVLRSLVFWKYTLQQWSYEKEMHICGKKRRHRDGGNSERDDEIRGCHDSNTSTHHAHVLHGGGRQQHVRDENKWEEKERGSGRTANPHMKQAAGKRIGSIVFTVLLIRLQVCTMWRIKQITTCIHKTLDN